MSIGINALWHELRHGTLESSSADLDLDLGFKGSLNSSHSFTGASCSSSTLAQAK